MRTNRRGYLLIEMLVAVTAASLVLGLSVGALALLFRLERTGREHVHHAASLGRLAEQFRNDVHAAIPQALDKTPGKDGWRFAIAPDRAVRYSITPESVEREETAAGKTVGRESYAIPSNTTARFDAASDGNTKIVRLIVSPDSTPAAIRREIHIEAVLGRGRRFSETTDKKH
jgi:type II secretory pathway component PulJ